MQSKTFTYNNGRGFTAENCVFRANRYSSTGNLAVEIWNDEGCIIRVTLNDEVVLDDDHIAVKGYSENTGLENWLKIFGFIDREPDSQTAHGFPVYRITAKMKSALGKIPAR